MSQIVTVSSKGQITLPVAERKTLPFKQYLFKRKGTTITLYPIKIEVIDDSGREDDKDFYKLSDKSFDFWNDLREDVWDTFYTNTPSIK